MPLFADIEHEPQPAIRGRYFAPSVLSPFADDLAARLSRLTTGPLLEIMADTGTLTQALTASISVGLGMVATDPDPITLSFAAGKPGTARVTWRQADPAALPFEEASFGIIACLFGIATLKDRLRSFREARRVLKPGGRFVFAVPGTLHHNPVAACVHRVMLEMFPEDPPAYLGAILHGYGETELIDDDLTNAGFTDAAYTIVEVPFSAASAAEVAAGYCLGTALRSEIGARAGSDPRPVIEAVETSLRRQFGTGSIVATMRANVILAAG